MYWSFFYLGKSGSTVDVWHYKQLCQSTLEFSFVSTILLLPEKYYHTLGWPKTVRSFKMYCLFLWIKSTHWCQYLAMSFFVSTVTRHCWSDGVFSKLRSVSGENGLKSFENYIRAAKLFFDCYLWHHLTFPMKIKKKKSNNLTYFCSFL